MTKNLSTLAGKVAIVTGASRGVGRAIATRLGEEGAKVVINYRNRSDAADEVVESIQSAGSEAISVVADVTRVADIERLFVAAIETFGKPDIVIANAGIELIDTPITSVNEQQFDDLYRVNVKGTYFVLREAARHLNDGGRLIVIGSTTTIHANAGFSAYAGSKAAGRLYVETLAQELGPRQITVNSVIPGPLSDAGVLVDAPADAVREMSGLSPMGRMGTSNDVHGAVAFLAADEAQWISGQHLVVNGAAKI